MKYLENTYLFETEAKVISQGADYVVLDDTIFYPQGGGQPCDLGTIADMPICNVKTIDGEIRHYSDILMDCLGKVVSCRINQERRMINARYHTAGHLLAGIVEDLYPGFVPTKCHAYPGEAYVEFCGDGIVPDITKLQAELDTIIHDGVNTTIFEINRAHFETKYYKLPYEIPDNKTFRVLQIGAYKPVPCGGTHISNTKEIENARIKKAKVKSNILKIAYEICLAD